MKFRADIVAVVLLCAAIILSWCNANAMWSKSAWKLPTAYLGPYRAAPKSDVLLHLAFIRAARDGNFVPLRSKTIPELGAPHQANWDDWPITEELPIFSMGLLARLAGIFAALNIALLGCHLLAGLSFYFVARFRNVEIVWAFAAALAFGLASYIFSESPDHVLVALCWQVPLFILVWDWVSSDEGITLGSKKFWFGAVVGFIAGLQMPYYAGVFCQLVLLGCLISWIRTRSAKQFLSPLGFIGTTALAFFLMNIDTWMDQIRFGRNSEALVRPYQWLEIYGLKLVDLVTPPLNHHWQLFRSFAEWRARTAILHDEGSYFGIVGIAALLILIGVSVCAAIQSGGLKMPKAGWQALWIYLFFTTGGLNALIGLAGFRFFRTGCRFSIAILAIALLFAAEWLSNRRQRFLAIPAAILLSIVVLIDQVPAQPSREQTESIARQVSSDQKFVADMESNLPANAMVFQLPVMDFPESPLRTVSGYDHLRPYLYSHQLRFSFGSVKGRPREQWQHDLEKMSLSDSIDVIKRRGFSGLYVNRRAYPDNGHDIEQNLRALGHKVIESSAGDLFFVVLVSPGE